MTKKHIVIIGAGAAGSVLAGQLAGAGLKVTCLDAGPFWKPDKDWVSDEMEMEKLFWDGPRVNASEGANEIGIGKSTSGKGIGGGTVHYSMMSLRLHPSDFKTRSMDDVGEDWPLEYNDLEKYYDFIENELPVAGPDVWPWDGKGNYPQPPHVLDCQAELFLKGCERLEIKTATCPLALVTGFYNSPYKIQRNPCINRGFCHEGCKPNAKSSALTNFIPKALKHSAKIIDEAMVTKLITDEGGLLESVEYRKNGKKEAIEADIFILSAFTIETVRLLLASKNNSYSKGLANSSGLVGKYLLAHSDHLIYSKFKAPVRGYRNPPTTVISEDFYETDNKNDYKRGFSVAPYSGRPIDFVTLAVKNRSDLWGKKLKDFMKDYNQYIRNGFIGEVLPDVRNRVEITNELDEYNLPIPIVYFKYGENDKKIIEKGLKVSKDIMKRAGAYEFFTVNASAHLLGGCRMGNDPRKSVTDKYGKTHDIDNLYIAGAPLFVTTGAVNPTLTIQALAARTADHIIKQLNKSSKDLM